MMSFKSVLAAGSLSLLSVNIASGETYRLSTWNSAKEGQTIAFLWLAEQIKEQTDGAIEFETFLGGALLPAKTTMQGVADGVAHVGFHTAGYTPSELPLSNSLTGYGFVERNPLAIGAAFTDFMMNDAAMNAEFTDNGVVPVGGFSTPVYPIICNTSEPVISIEDFKGKKVRFPGGMNGKLTEHLGGVAVNIPAPEIYQALQTGQIDCAGIYPSWLNIDNSLQEVSKSVTMMGWTGSFNSPFAVYNQAFWQSITDDQRRIILSLTARATARMQIDAANNQEKALATAVAEIPGFQVVEPDESIQSAVQKWIDAGVGDMAGVARQANGVADPEALFARFDPYVKKWHDLIAGMEDPLNEDELTAILQANIMDKVDVSTYGMK